MRFLEHAEAGRKLTAKQVDDQVRELARDPRFPALVALLERNERAWIHAVSNQKMADAHGKIAHAAGSLHALQILIAQVTTILDRPVRRQVMEQEGD
jgi:hypothetical protein